MSQSNSAIDSRSRSALLPIQDSLVRPSVTRSSNERNRRRPSRTRDGYLAKSVEGRSGDRRGQRDKNHNLDNAPLMDGKDDLSVPISLARPRDELSRDWRQGNGGVLANIGQEDCLTRGALARLTLTQSRGQRQSNGGVLENIGEEGYLGQRSLAGSKISRSKGRRQSDGGVLAITSDGASHQDHARGRRSQSRVGPQHWGGVLASIGNDPCPTVNTRGRSGHKYGYRDLENSPAYAGLTYDEEDYSIWGSLAGSRRAWNRGRCQRVGGVLASVGESVWTSQPTGRSQSTDRHRNEGGILASIIINPFSTQSTTRREQLAKSSSESRIGPRQIVQLPGQHVYEEKSRSKSTPRKHREARNRVDDSLGDLQRLQSQTEAMSISEFRPEDMQEHSPCIYRSMPKISMEVDLSKKFTDDKNLMEKSSIRGASPVMDMASNKKCEFISEKNHQEARILLSRPLFDAGVKDDPGSSLALFSNKSCSNVISPLDDEASSRINDEVAESPEVSSKSTNERKTSEDVQDSMYKSPSKALFAMRQWKSPTLGNVCNSPSHPIVNSENSAIHLSNSINSIGTTEKYAQVEKSSLNSQEGRSMTRSSKNIERKENPDAVECFTKPGKGPTPGTEERKGEVITKRQRESPGLPKIVLCAHEDYDVSSDDISVLSPPLKPPTKRIDDKETPMKVDGHLSLHVCYDTPRKRINGRGMTTGGVKTALQQPGIKSDIQDIDIGSNKTPQRARENVQGHVNQHPGCLVTNVKLATPTLAGFIQFSSFLRQSYQSGKGDSLLKDRGNEDNVKACTAPNESSHENEVDNRTQQKNYVFN